MCLSLEKDLSLVSILLGSSAASTGIMPGMGFLCACLCKRICLVQFIRHGCHMNHIVHSFAEHAIREDLILFC